MVRTTYRFALAVVVSVSVVFQLFGARVASANPLSGLNVSSECESSSHTVTINYYDIGSPRSITIIGQDLVSGTWTDSGSSQTISISVGSTQSVTTLIIPVLPGTTAYRVRVVASSLDNSSGAVSNTVGCSPPTSAATATPTATATRTVTSTATATPTSAPPDSGAPKTQTLEVGQQSSPPPPPPAAPADTGAAAQSFMQICHYEPSVGRWMIDRTTASGLPKGDEWPIRKDVCDQHMTPTTNANPTTTTTSKGASVPQLVPQQSLTATPTAVATSETAATLSPEASPPVQETIAPSATPAVPDVTLTPSDVPAEVEDVSPALPPVQIPLS